MASTPTAPSTPPTAVPLRSRSPIDGATVGEVDAASPADVARLAAGLAASADGWKRRGAVARAAIVVELGRLIASDREHLATLVATEVGKPIAEARGEVDRAAAICAYHGGVGNELGGDLRSSGDPRVMILARQVPVGVAGVITPWNFPLAIPAWKIVPALVAGCPVLWKPAPQAVACAEALLALARRAGLGPDELAIVHGDADVGSALVAAPLDALSFTGSTAVGLDIRRARAELGGRLTLELGGVNVAHVLPDADLEAAADDLVAAAFGFAGQKCTATQVVAVREEVADELTAALVERLGRLRVGSPLEAGNSVGPVIDEEAARRIRGVVDELAGRHEVHRAPAPDGGAYVAPALVLGDDDLLTGRELFGPVAAVVRTRGLDDHAAVAGRSGSALSAAIYGRDAGEIRRTINVVGTAVVAVNRASTGLDPHVPFGGWGASAGGFSEQGVEALRSYSKWQTVYWRSSQDGVEFP